MRRRTLDQAAIAAVEFIINEERLSDEDKVWVIRAAIAEHHREQGVRYILPRRAKA